MHYYFKRNVSCDTHCTYCIYNNFSMLFYKEQPKDVKIKCTRAQYFIDICCYQYKILFSWQKKNFTQCIFQADAFSSRDYKYICINLTLQTKNSYSCVNGKCHFLSVFLANKIYIFENQITIFCMILL